MAGLIPNNIQRPGNTSPGAFLRFVDQVMEYFRRVTKEGGVVTNQNMIDTGLFDEELQPHMVTQPEAVDRMPVPTALDLSQQLYTSKINNAALAQATYLSRIIADWNTAGPRAHYYEVELWLSGALLRSVPTAGLTIQFDALEPGDYTVMLRAVGAYSYKSRWVSGTITVRGKTAEPQEPGSFACYVQDVWLILAWSAPDEDTDPDIAGYLIREGTNWYAPVKSVNVGKVTQFKWEPSRSGTIQFMIKSVDTSGLESILYRSTSITLRPPQTVPNLTYEVIDNNVILHWGEATRGDYPVREYEVWKGTDFATAVKLGSITGTAYFTFETIKGTYKYWVRAVDTAGLSQSDPLLIASVYATVSAPPDFVLVADQDISLSAGTMVRACENLGSLLMLLDPTLDFTNAYSTFQEEIDAGLVLFAQPGLSTASYEMIVDFGTLISAGKIVFDVTRALLAGEDGAAIGWVTVTPELSFSADDVTYSTPENLYETFATAFQYVKFRVYAVGTGGAILNVTRLHARIEMKAKTLTGRVTIPGTVGYATVYLTDDGTAGGNKVFADVASIQVTGKMGTGSIPLTGFYDFTDIANPLSFVVHLRRTDDGAVFVSDAEASYAVGGY